MRDSDDVESKTTPMTLGLHSRAESGHMSLANSGNRGRIFMRRRAALIAVVLVGTAACESSDGVLSPAPSDLADGPLAAEDKPGESPSPEALEDPYTGDYSNDGPLVLQPAIDWDRCGDSPLCAQDDGTAEADLVLHEGCIFLGGFTDPARDVPTLAALLPADYSWDDVSRSIVTPDGDRLAVGDRLTWGGGETDLANLRIVIPGREPPAELKRCVSLADGLWHASFVGAES